MHKISNFPKKIFNFFKNETKRLGKETQFKKRSSKLTPSAFIEALISTCYTGNFGLEILGCALKTQRIRIKKQSLHERFNERTVEFVKALSSSLLQHFESEKLSQPNSLKGFSNINIIDSSSVSLHGSLSKLFRGSGGAASKAALKIQLMFDYLQGQIKELTLTSGCDNDQGFDNYFNSIQKGALYLMDLGYFKLDSFKKIIDGEGFFLSRLLTGTKLFTTEQKPLDLLTILSKTGPIFSQHVLLGSRHKIPVRLIAQRLPQEVAARRRQRLKEDHRRRGKTPSKESLDLQDWSIYITNASETQIHATDIHPIYALRWQIELLFKLSKSLMHIDIINSRKSARVVIETYGKFICMMLLFLLCEPIRYQNDKEVSLFKACKILMTKLADLARAFSSAYRLKNFINSFYESVACFGLKEVKNKTTSELALSSRESF